MKERFTSLELAGRSINTQFAPQIEELIERLAEEREESPSEVIRVLVSYGLTAREKALKESEFDALDALESWSLQYYSGINPTLKALLFGDQGLKETAD